MTTATVIKCTRKGKMKKLFHDEIAMLKGAPLHILLINDDFR